MKHRKCWFEFQKLSTVTKFAQFQMNSNKKSIFTLLFGKKNKFYFVWFFFILCHFQVENRITKDLTSYCDPVDFGIASFILCMFLRLDFSSWITFSAVSILRFTNGMFNIVSHNCGFLSKYFKLFPMRCWSTGKRSAAKIR